MNRTLRVFAYLMAGAAVLLLVSAAPAQSCSGGDGTFDVLNEDIQKTIDDANSYKPGLRDYYVRDFDDDQNIYLLAALSPMQRADWLDKWKDPVKKKCFADRLDELAAAAAKTIGSYRPAGYTFGTPAEKALLKSSVDDIGKATILSSGLKAATWKIAKEDDGIPRERVKYGMIWARYPDEKFCQILYVNVVQAYSGGGTYNTSEGRYISREFAACPAK